MGILRVKSPAPRKRIPVARLANHCGSEPARDGLKGDAFIQKTRVIVNVHREQARSHIGHCATVRATGQIRKLPTSCFKRAACRSRSEQARKVDWRFSTPS